MGSNYEWNVPLGPRDGCHDPNSIIRRSFIELDPVNSMIRIRGIIYQLVLADGQRTIDVWSRRLNRHIQCHQFITTTGEFFSVLDRDLAYFDSPIRRTDR